MWFLYRRLRSRPAWSLGQISFVYHDLKVINVYKLLYFYWNYHDVILPLEIVYVTDYFFDGLLFPKRPNINYIRNYFYDHSVLKQKRTMYWVSLWMNIYFFTQTFIYKMGLSLKFSLQGFDDSGSKRFISVLLPEISNLQ